MRPLPVLAALLLTLPVARALEPASFVLSHHGRLLAAGDAPVEGTIALRFRLYTSPVPLPGETAEWDETYDVTVANGVYVAVLGDETQGQALTTAHLDGSTPRYLSVSVAEGPELLPRQRLGAVPYAVNAQRLGNLPAADYLTRADAADAYLEKSDAAATYVTSEQAATTYVTRQSAESTYLATTDAASTYETLAGAAAKYLEKTAASDTYLDKGTASSTYATKSEVSDVARQADLAPFAKTEDVAADYLSRADDAKALRRNLVSNGSFEAWTGVYPNVAGLVALPIGWGARDEGQTGVTRTRHTDGAPEGRTYLRFYNPGSNGTNPETYLTFAQPALEANRTYTLAFWARASIESDEKLDVFVLATDEDRQRLEPGYIQHQFVKVALTKEWQRFSRTFTTTENLGLAANTHLRFDHNGNGAHIDLDGVGLWQGSYAPAFSEARAPCPTDMVDAGEVCIERLSNVEKNLHWVESHDHCRATGRRLCSASELGFALRRGVIPANDHTAGNLWLWTSDLHDTAAQGSFFPCHLNMSFNMPNHTLGEVNCQLPQGSVDASIGRLCCASR